MSTHQTLDRTAVITFALAAASLAVTWVLSLPAVSAKQATAPSAPAATVAAEEGPYKVVVTAQRLQRPVDVAGVVASQPRI